MIVIRLGLFDLFRLNIRLYLITQLSNALRYLESENIVHRDIAARNCLLYPNYEMKLTHTAMASKEFPHHYFTIDHYRLPIRWMAPESIANVTQIFQNDDHPPFICLE